MLTPSLDRMPVSGVRFEHLDLELIERTMQNGHQLGRYNGPLDVSHYLLRSGGVVEVEGALIPTVSGVLAFTQEPDRWMTASGIDMSLYRSDVITPTGSRVRQFRGPVFQIIDAVVNQLKEECTVSRLDGAKLVNALDTPEIVLRELTTNGIVHRDLQVYGSQVRIQIYPQHIEWISPGSLPAGITIQTIFTAQFSRNPSLAQFLFHAGYIEKFGMGLDAVRDALTRTGSEPEFHDDGHSFRVRIRRSVGGNQGLDLTTREGRSEAILDLFGTRAVWRQHDLLQHLDIPRSTLQRDLDVLVKQGQLTVRGSTRSRVYLLPGATDPAIQISFSDTTRTDE